MDYVYLGAIVVLVAVAIVYSVRRGHTGQIIQDGDMVSELPIIFGYAGELRIVESGRLFVQQGQLVIVDSKDAELLRVPIGQALQIVLHNYFIWRAPWWDVNDGSGRTIRFAVKTPFSLFYMFTIANRNELLIRTINRIATTDIVRVTAMARPSSMRIFETIRWVVIIGGFIGIAVYLWLNL